MSNLSSSLNVSERRSEIFRRIDHSGALAARASNLRRKVRGKRQEGDLQVLERTKPLVRPTAMETFLMLHSGKSFKSRNMVYGDYYYDDLLGDDIACSRGILLNSS